ncbi:CopG family transcriptional regulator [Microbacterium sp. 2FI]|uniref:CopG family transcriptional regulator n=1 Tax=Microbacterium sp. 2FI TaxID=2502193 RepID=UPI0010F8A056|nr:CopG family transcriptional regulator [Microbacterium sp. 2FI]
MRTTLTIDDDVLAAAKQFADARGLTLGEALSQLARATLTERRRFGTRNGIVLLPAATTAGRAELEDVNALRDES